jgi:hypothetical protein
MNVLWTLHGIPDVGPRGIANDSRLDPALPGSASQPKKMMKTPTSRTHLMEQLNPKS